MNASELALKMLEAEKLNKQIKQIEAEIIEAVLELKDTQKVGLVKAAYTNGRRELDWQGPAMTAPADVIAKFTTETPSTDWKQVCEVAKVEQDIIDEFTRIDKSIDYAGICKELKLEADVIKEGTPSVKITYS
jgi:hypothetical protein